MRQYDGKTKKEKRKCLCESGRHGAYDKRESERRSRTRAENPHGQAVQARAAIPNRRAPRVVQQEASIRVEADVGEVVAPAAAAAPLLAAALDCAEVATAEFVVCEPLALPLAEDRPPEDVTALDDDADETARETAVGAGSVPSKGVLAPKLVEVGAGIVKREAAVPVGTSDDGTLDGEEELALAMVIMSV